jgi:hypothetical protein
MSLLFIEGFDHDGYTSGTSQVLSHYSKWGRNNGQIVNSLSGSESTKAFPTARTGNGCLYLNGLLFTKTLPASDSFVCGIAVICNGSNWNGLDIFQIREGATIHCVLGTDASNRLVVKRGASAVIATGTTVLGLNTWYYFEFKGTIHNTTGSFEVRINTTPETGLVATNVDTLTTGTGLWNNLGLIGTQNHYYDDLYVCNQAGAQNNDFLGMIKIETILPKYDQQAAGTHRAWIPSPEPSGTLITDHGARVRNNPPWPFGPYGKYNGSSTPGDKDSYRVDSALLAGPILGMQTNLYIVRSEEAIRSFCHIVRAGGADYEGPSFVTTTTHGSGPSFRSDIRELNPATGVAWTNTDMNTFEIGVKVVT